MEPQAGRGPSKGQTCPTLRRVDKETLEVLRPLTRGMILRSYRQICKIVEPRGLCYPQFCMRIINKAIQQPTDGWNMAIWTYTLKEVAEAEYDAMAERIRAKARG